MEQALLEATNKSGSHGERPCPPVTWRRPVTLLLLLFFPFPESHTDPYFLQKQNKKKTKKGNPQSGETFETIKKADKAGAGSESIDLNRAPSSYHTPQEQVFSDFGRAPSDHAYQSSPRTVAVDMRLPPDAQQIGNPARPFIAQAPWLPSALSSACRLQEGAQITLPPQDLAETLLDAFFARIAPLYVSSIIGGALRNTLPKLLTLSDAFDESVDGFSHPVHVLQPQVSHHRRNLFRPRLSTIA